MLRHGTCLVAVKEDQDWERYDCLSPCNAVQFAMTDGVSEWYARLELVAQSTPFR